MPPYRSRLDWKIIKMMSIIFNINISNINNFFIYKRLNELTPKFKNFVFNYSKSSKYEIKYITKYLKNFHIIDEYPFVNYYPFYCFMNSIERSSKILSSVMFQLKKEQSNFC